MRRAYSLFELLVTLSIVVAIAAVILPAASSEDLLRVRAASAVLRSDIELAQAMSIADPDAPVVVRFDVDRSRYWLAYAGTPDTPLPRAETGQPYLVVLGDGRARGAEGVTMTLDNITDGTITFAMDGGLVGTNDHAVIALDRNDAFLIVAAAPSTGTVREYTRADFPEDAED